MNPLVLYGLLALAALAALIFGVGVVLARSMNRVFGGFDWRGGIRDGGEHAVQLKIPLSGEGFGEATERERIRTLALELDAALQALEAGTLDGDEFGRGFCTLYLYGPNADAIFQAIEPVLRRSALPKGSKALQRFGPPGDPTSREVWRDL